MQHSKRNMSRRIMVPIGQTLFALAGLALLTAPPASAQNGWPAKWEVTLELPANSQEALASRSGLTWDQLRHNGLVLTTTGSGEISLVTAVLLVKDGKIVQKWSSPAFSHSSPGRMQVSGRYLPGDQYIGESGSLPIIESAPPVGVDVALSSIENGTIKFIDLRGGKSVVIVALPSGTMRTSGSGSSTSPLFFKSESHGDGP
jgi:hypothetical protein